MPCQRTDPGNQTEWVNTLTCFLKNEDTIKKILETSIEFLILVISITTTCMMLFRRACNRHRPNETRFSTIHRDETNGFQSAISLPETEYLEEQRRRRVNVAKLKRISIISLLDISAATIFTKNFLDLLGKWNEC